VDQNLPDESGRGAQANLNAWPCATEIVHKWFALHAFHRTHGAQLPALNTLGATSCGAALL
jgi:hypothetical protein